MLKSPESSSSYGGKEQMRNEINSALDRGDYAAAKNLIDALQSRVAKDREAMKTGERPVEGETNKSAVDQIFDALEGYYRDGNYATLKLILDQSGARCGVMKIESDDQGAIQAAFEIVSNPGSERDDLLSIEYPAGSGKYFVFPPNIVPVPTLYQRWFYRGERKPATFKLGPGRFLVPVEFGGDGS